MKILVIDSHKGSGDSVPQNMHWQNAKIIADSLGADLIWSYPSVNDNIVGGYDVIIFVHASHYAYTDYEWLEKSPYAKLFYITNEYNLGEPRTLWMAAKKGRKYDVIANHDPEPSKVVMKYVNSWNNINLNALIYNPVKRKDDSSLFEICRDGCVYYGSFRKNRAKYFSKYLNENVDVSTHHKNIVKFLDVGVTSRMINRIDWHNDGLFTFKHSLYIEDEVTHNHYNHLANRFYEALNYNCIPLFSEECEMTSALCNYDIPTDFFISDSSEISGKDLSIPDEWHWIAQTEKEQAIERIEYIIYL